jgi:hypothetical protein
LEAESSEVGYPPPLFFPKLKVRNPYGSIPHSRESTHFVAWWGDDGPVISNETADALLLALEEVWAAEITEMAYPQPAGTDVYKMNFYLGDTDSRLPAIQGGAYYTVDIEGYPMLVSHTSMIQADLRGVAAHEFFHALQDACNTYEYSGQGAFYWEAGANWMPIEVFPDLRVSHDSIWAVVMKPELPLNQFKYPDEWTPETIHQYGAWIWVQYLDEVVGGPDLIRDSWTLAEADGDPLLMVGDLTETPVEALFFDFATRNATWDYVHGEEIEADAKAGMNDAESHWISGKLPAVDAEPVQPEFPPYTFGANYWRANALPASFALVFDPDAPKLDWHVALAWESEGEHHRIEMDQETRRMEVARWPGDRKAKLVVAVAKTTKDKGKTFSYSLGLESFDPPEETGGDTGPNGEQEESAGGCACSGSSHSPRHSWIVLSGLWIFLMRRQSRKRVG